MMSWIPIEIQMPPEKTPVLVTAKRWGGKIVLVAQWSFITEMYPVSWDCVGATGYECENDFEEDGVLYWMPLPEPPSE